MKPELISITKPNHRKDITIILIHCLKLCTTKRHNKKKLSKLVHTFYITFILYIIIIFVTLYNKFSFVNIN